MPELDSTLTARLREVLATDRVTEADLRELAEQGDGWARALDGQVAAAERRLAKLTRTPDASIAELAEALRQVEALRPERDEVRRLLAELDGRAHELRAGWLRAARET